MAIKLFISDLDGTLLLKEKVNNEDKVQWSEKVSMENIDALEKLSKNNIDFAICTGRIKGQVDHVSTEIGNIDKYLITQNGNFIYENQKLIAENTFTVEENIKLIQYIRDFGFKPVFTDENTIYIDLRYIKEETIQTLKMIYKNNYIKLINWNNPWEIMNSKVKPGMVSFNISRLNQRQKEDLRDVIQEDLPYTNVTISSPFVIDIFPKKSSKILAIQKLSKIYDIQLDEIAYVGDSGNDVSVFKVLKNSFVMSHSTQEVKKYANQEVDSVEQAINIVLKNNK